jgi:adenosine/AMP kinase
MKVLFAALSAVVTLAGASVQVLTLDDCLRIAMEKNHQRPASRFAVAMAEAQHRQRSRFKARRPASSFAQSGLNS